MKTDLLMISGAEHTYNIVLDPSATASRTITLPDTNANSRVVLDRGDTTIYGLKTFNAGNNHLLKNHHFFEKRSQVRRSVRIHPQDLPGAKLCRRDRMGNRFDLLPEYHHPTQSSWKNGMLISPFHSRIRSTSLFLPSSTQPWIRPRPS